MAGLLLGVVLVGGSSLAMALRISHNNEDVVREYGHILRHDEIRSLFDELVFELHQVDSTNASGRTTRALLVHDDIARRLDTIAGVHAADSVATEQERERVLLDDLRRLAGEAQALARRMSASGRFTSLEIEWLDRASHLVPERLVELGDLHRSRIAVLLDANQGLLRAIVLLYVAFLAIGAVLVGAVSVAANRSIAAPLRRLADAAQGIAAGRLDARVPVTSPNEIGQLSHTFNVMADRLETRELELRGAKKALEEKVRETQALYRLGTEISRLHQLDRVLQSVTDKARELLRCDVVVLCLFNGERECLSSRATAGPPEAFQTDGTGEGCAAPPSARCSDLDAPSLAVRPEYARAHLAAPLHSGGRTIGALHVSCRDAREFTASEVELLGGLATQAAIAIERARLAEELRSVAAVEERERIAREMHDGLAQALGLLHLKLQCALEHTRDPACIAKALREMVRITDHAYEDVRQSIFELRTFVSRGLGLVPTLTEYLHEYSTQNGIAVDLDVAEGTLGPLPPASEVQAVRIIQEALANVRKHARAEHAHVRLQREGDWVRVAVEDDGVGWDSLAPTERLHFGLQTMRERAEGLGGRLEIATAPGRGTQVVATLPGGAA